MVSFVAGLGLLLFKYRSVVLSRSRRCLSTLAQKMMEMKHMTSLTYSTYRTMYLSIMSEKAHKTSLSNSDTIFQDQR